MPARRQIPSIAMEGRFSDGKSLLEDALVPSPQPLVPDPSRKNTDAFAARTCDVLGHATGAAARGRSEPAKCKTSIRGKRVVENIHAVSDQVILLC